MESETCGSSWLLVLPNLWFNLCRRGRHYGIDRLMGSGGRGRKQGSIGLTQPRKADEPVSTGWWFPWQVKPFLLRRTPNGVADMYRKSVYRRSTGQISRGQAIIRAHTDKHGQWCPGLPTLLHRPHFLNPTDMNNWLTIDHVVPLSRGGTWKRKNLRILCYKANQRLNGIDMNGKRSPSYWW